MEPLAVAVKASELLLVRLIEDVFSDGRELSAESP
ncbi:hypothetical protein STVIR_1815 [Streptomyces viridochromogenes Tue57]|uniref:Uncharacterized protein n=1 Tax=Streptomyces viridochromogenes Tue57 TaxID=1160705 RepID=L8PMY2_STRVR|nr:hypothetical protein STVIR_1815 [Streptomyces viridochromogenes Tue57]